jgi:hypothetical protein
MPHFIICIKLEQPTKNPFDRAPILMMGAMCAKEATGTNLLPPKTICAYTSCAITGIPKPLAVSAISNIQ